MNIYIGNLSLETTEEELWQIFNAFGSVSSVSLMNDKHIESGQPRGYAFVKMASKSEGEAAIANLNGKELGGHVINLVEALPLSGKRDARLVLPGGSHRVNRRWGQRRP